MKNLFLVFPLSMLLFSATAQEPRAGQSKNEVKPGEAAQPMVALLSLKITNADNHYAVSLTNSRILDSGKPIAETSKVWIENDFVCFILNEEQRVTDTLVIHKPLKVRNEYPKDDGTIGYTITDLTENDVMLRFAYREQMKYLQFALAGESNKLTTLTTLQLPSEK